ncbi:MAG: alanine--tRNA ligase [Candidatus Gastranaerophilales bacterium]|nr:alanine--tRNA ligase [Candidatus Gastranaerophilales bacterium]
MSDKLTGNELRKKYIDFFVKKHNHLQYKSSSLIPDNPTVLLTTAGMLQFVPMFLGYEEPPNPPRIATVQKCARAGGKDSDIENVGRTPRHHTFFEMLGNFSFGDYFKEEIIPWAWDFVINEIKLDVERLWITVFETDDEAVEIWKKTGVRPERILKKGKKDNFWGPAGASGPCGPCSEIHYDLGAEYACCDNCGIDTCECDRFVEIWNLVFTELNQDEEGNLTPLAKKNVDTGMGLERVTMVVNGVTSTFDTDLLQPILKKVCELSSKEYKKDPKTDISIRIITDHARCVSFMIADGLTPSNEGRGYVERMILRRALRHGKILGLELPFLYKIVDTVVDSYKETYPELARNRDKIISVIKAEEERFKQTLDKGELLLSQLIEEAKQKKDKTISGADAFKLYDTFGFPMELTLETALEQGLKVDEAGFKKEMDEQKERAKAAHTKISLTQNLIFVDILKKYGETDFKGYETNRIEGAKVVAIVKDSVETDGAVIGDEVDIILDRTPLYAESGGQTGDSGIISNENVKIEVVDTIKLDNLFIHKAKITEGSIKTGDKVCAEVDNLLRKQIKAHHTLAHLLQAALVRTLGSEVHQAGSQVDSFRTRFDFNFDRGLSEDELAQIEDLMNEWINLGFDCTTRIMSVEDAKKSGATALFDEKYAADVRVVSVGDVSKELCGGLHVENISELKVAKIVSESAISAGVRRIEVICANSALKLFKENNAVLEQIAKTLKTPVVELEGRLEKILEDNKSLNKKIKDLQNQIAAGKMETLYQNATEGKSGRVLVERIDGVSADILKNYAEKFADKLGESTIVLCSYSDDKISIIAKVSDSIIAKGINAGAIVNEIAQACEGKGGGRPNFAQGGAKNPANLDNALKTLKDKLV